MLDLIIVGYLEMMGASIYKAYFRLKNSYYLLSCVCGTGSAIGPYHHALLNK
jgi:predicted solute-binding protein